jgi:hypothetical protein
MENTLVTSSFILGDIDEQDISNLEKEKGLVIELIPVNI